MLLQRSRLAAASLERPRLIQPWVLIGLGALTLLLLAAIFPFRTLVERVLATELGDPLTTSYLRNLLRTDPDNPELRLSLARQRAAAGEFAAARRTLEPLLSSANGPMRREALWTAWLMTRREMDRLPAASAALAPRQRELARELERLAGEDWDEATQDALAEQALQLGDLPLALTLFRKLEGRRDDLAAAWYARVAQLALGHGDYLHAARLYQVALGRAATRIERRQHFLAAVAALQSGNLLREALDFADANLGALADDQEVLYTLVQLARAADRPDLAEKYVRLLLRLSLLRQLLPPALAAHLDFSVLRSAAGAVRAPGLPFDDRIYRLGYEVFLGNRKLEDAYQVAAAAVRQAPQNAEWRLRLARVAEWTTRPGEALTHWRWLAQREGTDEAWQAVLRLAPGLFDDQALLEALQHRVAQGPLDARQAAELVALYERLGDPAGGLAFLERAYAARPASHLLDTLSTLAERAGEDERAIAYLQRLIERDGLNRARATRLASLKAARGDLAGAYALLDRVRPQVADADAEFWRLYAELAQLQQEEAGAQQAYEKLIAGGQATPADYAALLALLRDVDPIQAARLAERMAQRFERFDYLLGALGIWSQQARWQEVKRLLAALSREQLAAAQRNADFLRLRAQYHQHSGRPRLAQRDLERALALAPQDAALREAVLWQVIDSNDGLRLQALLARHEAAWSRDPQLHDALAAAHQGLSQPRLALTRYLTPRLAAKRGDFLWLMNYADVLEQDAQADRAWRLREALWREAQRPAFVAQEEALAAVRRVARARLAATQRPGDAQLVLLRQMLALDRRTAGEMSPPLKELAIAWLQSAGEYTAVRGFLWQQYARNLAQPLWAEISAALALDERSELAALLERHGARLPRSDRISAAQRVGDLRLATSLAFDAQEFEPDDDAIHLQLGEALLGTAHRAAITAHQRSAGVLQERETAADLSLALAPGLRLSLELGRITRSSRDAATIDQVPAAERFAEAGLAWRHDDGETRVTLGRRHGFTSTTPLRLERDQTIDRHLGLTLRLGRHVPSQDSAALRAAGMKDQLEVAARYQISRVDRVALQWSHARLLGQTATAFGSGAQWNAEYAHTLRAELQDVEVSAFASGSSFRRRDGSFDAALRPLLPPGGSDMALLFVPEGAQLWGLRLSSNVRLRQDYTRALRPFFSLALTQSGTLGRGYDLALGLAGSVVGGDHFQVGWNLSKGGSAAFSQTRDFGLSYRLYF